MLKLGCHPKACILGIVPVILRSHVGFDAGGVPSYGGLNVKTGLRSLILREDKSWEDQKDKEQTIVGLISQDKWQASLEAFRASNNGLTWTMTWRRNNPEAVAAMVLQRKQQAINITR